MHQMVTWRAGLGPLGADLEEPQVDLVLEQMGEARASQANPHVQLTVDGEEGFSGTMVSAQMELKDPVSLAMVEISGHLVRGLEHLDLVDLGGDQMVEMVGIVVSTVEGQAEGQALVASMEMSEMELERGDGLPTLVSGQLGGLILDQTGHREPPEDQPHHQQEDQEAPLQLKDQAHLQLEDQAHLQQEGHSLARRKGHLQDQPIGQAQEMEGGLVQVLQEDQLLHPPENHSRDQQGDQHWDPSGSQTLMETGEDQNLTHLEEMALEAQAELDLLDDQDLVAQEDLETVDHDQDKEKHQVLEKVEGLAPMVLVEGLVVSVQPMVALWTLVEHKGQMEGDLDLAEGKILEFLVEGDLQDPKSYEEEDSSLVLVELVEDLEEELEEDLESLPIVEDLLEVWAVEEDLEVLVMVEGLETLETEDDLEVLEMVDGLEVLEIMDDLEALELEEDLEALDLEEGLEALDLEEGLEALDLEEGQMVLEMEEDQEASEALEVQGHSQGALVPAIEVLEARDVARVNKVLEAEVRVEDRVALVAAMGWAVVLGSVILTAGEAKKCRALAAE